MEIYTDKEQYEDALKYWSNATADFYDVKNGVDITEDELPKELRPLCDYLSENYGMYTYLVQYKDKFGFALVNEYSEYTDEGTAKCTNNFEQAKKVAAEVEKNFPECTVLVSKQLGFPFTCDDGTEDPASELVVILDAKLFKTKDIDEKFEAIVDFLDKNAYVEEIYPEHEV